MPILTILPSQKTIGVTEGSTILDGLLAAGAGIEPKCGGKAQCASCHIFVHDGRKTLSKIQREENERLDQIPGVGSKSRLACQARFGAEDVMIEILGFNSGF
ncbi:MAG: 2Fe-2S iron-sulfur cluster-binding protein [Rhodomicrobium sp.]